MAHGIRAQILANSNREYWGRRPNKMICPMWGRFSKTLTHRKERREGKSQIRRSLDE